MPQPPDYAPLTDFSQEASNQISGRATIRPEALDAELDALAAFVDQARANLALLQRDDGELRDGIVKPHALSGETITLLASTGWVVRGDWQPTTEYAIGDLVREDDVSYAAVMAHTSDAADFQTDYTAGKWLPLGSAADTLRDVLTTRGDLVVRGSMQEQRLALGARGALLAAGAGDPAWLAAGGERLWLRMGVADPEWAALPLLSAHGTLAPHSGLRITNASGSEDTHLAITAAAVLLTGPAGEHRVVTSVTTTPTITASGAGGLDTGSEASDTWYHVWLLLNPASGDVKGLLSLSPTAPTLPAGYTFKGYIGAVRNDAVSNFVRVLQIGAQARGTNQTALSLTNAVDTTSGSFSLAPTVPVTAKMVRGNVLQTAQGASTNYGYTLAADAALVFNNGAPQWGAHGSSYGDRREFILQNLSDVMFYVLATNGQNCDFVIRINGWEF